MEETIPNKKAVVGLLEAILLIRSKFWDVSMLDTCIPVELLSEEYMKVLKGNENFLLHTKIK